MFNRYYCIKSLVHSPAPFKPNWVILLWAFGRICQWAFIRSKSTVLVCTGGYGYLILTWEDSDGWLSGRDFQVPSLPPQWTKFQNLPSSQECCHFTPFYSFHRPTSPPGSWMYLLLSNPPSLAQAFKASSKLLLLAEGISPPPPSSTWTILMIFKKKWKSHTFICVVYQLDSLLFSLGLHSLMQKGDSSDQPLATWGSSAV